MPALPPLSLRPRHPHVARLLAVTAAAWGLPMALPLQAPCGVPALPRLARARAGNAAAVPRNGFAVSY